MRINRRKVYVGALALQAVLVVYFIFIYLNPTVMMEMDKQPPSDDVSGYTTEKIGHVGTLGIGSVDAAKFVDFNEDKTINREFGFEKMLHRTGEQWQVEKPFINIYQDEFRCRITADKAIVLAAETGTTASFKEATLIGNVIVKVLPVGKNDIGPVTIYLDDIVFISERSLFLTAGPVKMIAEDAQLLGRGLELVYNYEANRIELLRIIHLETLCINKMPKHKSLVQKQADTLASAAAESAEGKLSDKYIAAFSGNVMIRTAQQLVFADDRLNIINILRTRPPLDETPEEYSESEPEGQAASQDTGGFMDVILTCENGLVVSPMDSPAERIGFLPIARRQSDMGRSKARQLRDSGDRDVLLTHSITYDAIERTAAATGKSELTFHVKDSTSTDGSTVPITIETDEQITFDRQSNQVIFEGNCTCSFTRFGQKEFRKYLLRAPQFVVDLNEEKNGRNYLAPAGIKHITANRGTVIQIFSEQSAEPSATFNARRIDFYPDMQLIRATGSTELQFLAQSAGRTSTLPVTITARRTRFDLSSNKVTFEGNCSCRTAWSAGNDARTYKLSAEKIIATLPGNKEQNAFQPKTGIRKLSAVGNAVITVLKPEPDNRQIAKFASQQIDYDSHTQNIISNGPSLLEVFTNAFNNKDRKPTPVTITAQKKTSYSLTDNQAVFQGDCVCTMIRNDSQVSREYKLTAPKITVDTAAEETSDEFASSIQSITADNNATIVVSPIDSITELAKFRSPKIKYNASAQNIIADSPCNFSFYANDFMPTETLGTAVPVTVNAEERTTFLPEADEIIFEGNCICTAVRTRGYSQNKYTLSAQRLSIKLSKDQRSVPTASALGIEHVTADGGTVQLSNIKTSQGKLREFSRLKCQRFEFHTPTKIFSAFGPGLITVDNSKIAGPNKKAGRFSLSKRCYAFLRDFESLKYFLNKNRIVAHNQAGKMLIDYFPIENDKNTEQLKASAGNIKINILKSRDGPTEISSLLASNGVTYEDRENQFAAARLSYDFSTATIRAYSDSFHRCYLNGAIVDNIIYDTQQGSIMNLQIKDAGMAQINR